MTVSVGKARRFMTIITPSGQTLAIFWHFGVQPAIERAAFWSALHGGEVFSIPVPRTRVRAGVVVDPNWRASFLRRQDKAARRGRLI